MVNYILIVVIIVLLLCLCNIYIKYKSLKDKYEEQTDMYTYYKNKLSMIEYHFRNYTEGGNPFTTLRKLGDIIQDYYIKLGSNKRGNDE